MDKLDQYRTIIKNILEADAHYKPSHGDIDPIIIFDEQHDHYQLMYLGWDRPRRVHAVIVHLRLHDGKIWIEYNGTAEGVAQALLDAGVPKEDIVLAFHPPEKRPFTGFAVA
ncbi:MAG: XisI protein [Chloroflexaceae bacterium]